MNYRRLLEVSLFSQEFCKSNTKPNVLTCISKFQHDLSTLWFLNDDHGAFALPQFLLMFTDCVSLSEDKQCSVC